MGRQKGAHRPKHQPLKPEELAAIFAGFKFPTDDPLPWLCLIGLYSGMRLEEIAGLRCEDVRTEDGVTFFQVEPYPGHDIKTDAARRGA